MKEYIRTCYYCLSDMKGKSIPSKEPFHRIIIWICPKCDGRKG